MCRVNFNRCQKQHIISLQKNTENADQKQWCSEFFQPTSRHRQVQQSLIALKLCLPAVK